MKNIIIISGVTGSIGQELLRKYLVQEDTTVYGISRKGVPIASLDILLSHHLIVSVDLHNTASMQEFVSKISAHDCEKISYFHLVGEFKTEINDNLDVVVENDKDGDGIDDCVYSLVTNAYIVLTTELLELATKNNCEFSATSFGSLADRHTIACFQSFRKAREMTISFTKEMAVKYPEANFYLFNTSTILAADEMIERPFIFSTNVNPVYWITPSELVHRTLGFMNSENGIVEKDIYLANPNFSSDYFSEKPTYKRRVKEMYNKNI